MSFIDCLISAAGKGDEVDFDAGAATKEYTSLVKEGLDEGMTRSKAEMQAQKKMIENATDEVFYAREQIDNATKFKKVMDWIQDSGLPLDEAIGRRLDMVFHATEAEEMKVNRILADVANELKVTFLGSRSAEASDQIGRMLFSGKFDNSPLGLAAQALRKAESMTVLEFKASGGWLSPRKNFLPEIHNPAKMRRRIKGQSVEDAKSEWVNTINETHNVMHPKTGEIVTDQKLKLEILDDAYDKISTRGRAETEARIGEGDFTGLNQNKRLRSYGGRRLNKKILHAKSYDSWVDYNTKYGSADSPVDAMLHNMYQLARETAVLKHLGTNPNAIRDTLGDLLSESIDKAGGSFVKGKRMAIYDSKFQILTNQGLHHEADGLDKFVTGTAHLVRSATLGMGGLSALPDIPLVRATGVFNGLNPTRMMKNYFKLMGGGGKAEREALERTGYLGDTISGTLHLAERDSGIRDSLANSRGIAPKLSHITNKVSGLARVTNVGKMVAHLEAVTYMAEQASIPWGKLNKNFKASLIESGILQKDWNKLNKLGLDDITLTSSNGKVRAIDTGKIRAADLKNTKGLYDLADAIDGYAARMQLVATNEATLTSKAITQGDAVIKGNKSLKTMVFMYKTFPLSVMINHVIPAFKKSSLERNMLSYRFHVIGLTTLFGYASISAKNILNGKEPPKTDNPKTWLSAMAAGGGFGLYGDLMNPRTYSFGGGPTENFVKGPVGDVFDGGIKTAALGVEASYKYLKGDVDGWEKALNKVGKEALRTTKRVTPLKNAWFANLMFERGLFDFLRSVTDNDYEKSINRQIKNAERDGQPYYFKPGETSPDLEQLKESIVGDE